MCLGFELKLAWTRRLKRIAIAEDLRDLGWNAGCAEYFIYAQVFAPKIKKSSRTTFTVVEKSTTNFVLLRETSTGLLMTVRCCDITVKVKVKGKGHPRTGHGGPEGE